MKNLYVSVDVEASGPTPGKYSMLSFGACVVGNSDQQFYAEFKPISRNYIAEAMRVGCLGLDVLRKQSDESYDPKSENFSCEAALHALWEDGVEPRVGMKGLIDWLTVVSKPGQKIVLCSDTAIFDGMFTYYYLDNYAAENPFGFGGMAFSSICKGLLNDAKASLKNIKAYKPKGVTHNALHDAIVHSHKMEKVLQQLAKA